MLRAILMFSAAFAASIATALPNNPIVFVAQMPIPQDFTTINATFGNHLGSVTSRGFSDLYIRYPNGNLRNLTAAAGYGQSGLQGAGSIAVRDPAVHWSGAKIIFSMVIGSATQQYQVNNYYWQLYEITNFAENETPVITKIINQPPEYNNVMPIYASNGTDIFFVSDRPRSGERHHYPQRDEYESSPSNSGIWALTPATGVLKIIDHSPSGNFDPIIDSFGRIIFTRWDHLQRDQQSDNEGGISKNYGAFNYSDESSSATNVTVGMGVPPEVFPEHQDAGAAAEADPTINQHQINHFFPWMSNQDGSELETLNHIGRHELHSYIQRTFNNDPELDDYYGQYSRFNQNTLLSMHHIQEDPLTTGRYCGIDCPEFGTHASGQIVCLTAPPGQSAGAINVEYVTHRATATSSDSPSADHSGLYRNPLPLSDGSMIASHTSETRQDSNIGTSTSPQSRYSFRLKSLQPGGNGFMTAGATLTAGINKTISFWSPDELRSYSGILWELQPVEVKQTTPPTATSHPALQTPEATIFASKGQDVTALSSYLAANNLAMIIVRNATVRDSLDIQQPFNLLVDIAGGVSSGLMSSTPRLIKYMQLFGNYALRGYLGYNNSNPWDGRRGLAAILSETHTFNLHTDEQDVGSVPIYPDGSIAAVVPAGRALSWQLTNDDHIPIVRERYWLSFKAGEIRVCASCHGLTNGDQNGNSGEPTNPPQALAALLDKLNNLPASNPEITLKVSKPKFKRGVGRYTITVSGSSGTIASLRIMNKSSQCNNATKNIVLSTTPSRYSFSVRHPKKKRTKLTVQALAGLVSKSKNIPISAYSRSTVKKPKCSNIK